MKLGCALWLVALLPSLSGRAQKQSQASPREQTLPPCQSPWGLGPHCLLEAGSHHAPSFPSFPPSGIGVPSVLPPEVPLNHKRCVCDLTPAERLALYDFVVQETKKQRPNSSQMENDSDLFVDLAAKVSQGMSSPLLHLPFLLTMCRAGAQLSAGHRAQLCCAPPDTSRKSPKSYLEILAEVRDYKRRRQSYRAKNVHITKKSYTEVRAPPVPLWVSRPGTQDGPCPDWVLGCALEDCGPVSGHSALCSCLQLPPSPQLVGDPCVVAFVLGALVSLPWPNLCGRAGRSSRDPSLSPITPSHR